MNDEILPSIYKVVSNRIRRRMIQLLSQEKLTYLELLISTGLEPDRHHGWFDYHLKVLLDEGILTKEDDQYLLTNYGEGISRLLDSIKGESQRIFGREVNRLKERIKMRSKAPIITMEEIVGGKMTIVLDPHQPLWQQGEHRIYKGSNKPEIELQTCLERIFFTKVREYHSIMLYEGYVSEYDGTEENKKIVNRTEEGYFLDTWAKVWEVQKQDGVYITKSLYWCAQGPTEKEEEVPKYPKKYPTFPMGAFPSKVTQFTFRIGDKFTEKDDIKMNGEKQGEVITKGKILGEYEVKIGEAEHDC
ncbi:MAG: winged helix-turn-helix domain-containing protein, partial [Candidatus Heimdallarchaeaceae archaeon]